MKEAIEKARKRLEATYQEQKDLIAFITLAQKICDHQWVYSHTCQHKGEDFEKCEICGETR